MRATTQRVEREIRFQTAPVAKLLGGAIVQLAFGLDQEQTEKEQATEEGELTGEPTAEKQEEDDELFGSHSSNVLGACTSALSTTIVPSSFEKKHSSDGEDE